MNQNWIKEAEAFLKKTFEASAYLTANPAERDYRLEHSYRVANLAKMIAEQENLDVTCAVIAGLLHDIAYCEEMPAPEDRRNHGRRSAAIARPFLKDCSCRKMLFRTFVLASRSMWMTRQISSGRERRSAKR